MGYREKDFAVQNFTAYHRKTAHCIEFEVERFVRRWGIEHVAFFTLTFADHVTTKDEAARRFNSLLTHVLRDRYPQGIVQWERMKSGRWHVHALVAIPGADIRTGFDWAAVESGDYRSVGKALREEWSFWRRTAKAYRFGRTEMRPIRTTVDAVARYVSKYLAKHVDHRLAEDKRVRVLSFWGYSVKDESGKTHRGVKRRASTAFAWNSKGAKLWRARVRGLAADCGVEGLEGLREALGPRWAYWLMRLIESEATHEAATAVEHRRPEGLGSRCDEASCLPGGTSGHGTVYTLDRSKRFPVSRVRSTHTPTASNSPEGCGGSACGVHHGQHGQGTGPSVGALLCRLTEMRQEARRVRATKSRTLLPKRSGEAPPGRGVKVEATQEHYLDPAEDGVPWSEGGAGGMERNLRRQGRGVRLAVGSWAAYSCPQDNV